MTVDTPVNDTPKLDDADSASLSDRARQRLRKIGAVIASIAAVGAVVSGLSGYWNFWKTVRTDLFYELQVDGKSAKTAISSGLIVSKGPSVAVLPVTNPAKATALEPVAATIAQQLTSSLGKFSTLRVMSRATAANFLKQDDTVEAARKAGVDYLVTSEIRPLGEGARASIQVADLHTGTEIWSKSFDASAEGVRTETDAYEIGDAAAAQIGGYPGAISIADYKKIQSKPVAELNSYQCIISAVVGGLIGSSSAGLRALECSKRLTEDEPNNALAWAARTSVLSNQRIPGIWLGARPSSARRKAPLPK